MFLTKKSRFKILIMALCYFILGSICIALWAVSKSFGIETKILYLGIILYLLCPLFVLWGRYAEGKGKLINLGNKLVRNELKPAEFIKHYENLKSSPDLVVGEPSIEVLHLVSTAYELLGDKERSMQTIDEMLLIANDKKKNLVKLIKVSHLFDCGRTDEAEALFEEVRNTKMNFVCQTLSDAVLKGDRAKAWGDYKTVESYNLKQLEQSFPRLDNAGRLVVNFSLAEAYEKMGNIEKAIQYYKYCAENGGETAVKISAQNVLENLKNGPSDNA